MVLRRSTRLLVTLGVVAVLLVAGGIAAASLLGRKTEVPAEAYDEAAAAAPPHDSWQPVNDTTAKLAFDVPPDWELADEDESLTTSNGVKLGHLADYGLYTCQGAEYGRAFAASGVAQPDRKPGKAAAELAAAVAADQYSDGSRTASVKVERPQPLAVGGAQGAVVRAEATVPDAGDETDECTGSKGTVTVVALPTAAGNSVLVIAADSVAGPDEPTPLADPARLEGIVKSLRVAP